MDLRACGTLPSSDADVLNRLTDVGRHDLCVAVPQRSIQAYASLFSFDPLVKMTVDLQPVVDFSPLPALLPVALAASTLNMNISRYYQDVGDARNDLEYILAMKQISIHVYDLDRDRLMRELQDRLTASAEGAFPEQHFLRRHALFLSSNTTDFANDAACVARNKGNWMPIANTAKIETPPKWQKNDLVLGGHWPAWPSWELAWTINWVDRLRTSADKQMWSGRRAVIMRTGRRAELLGVKFGCLRSRCRAVVSDVLCVRSYVHFVCVCVYMCMCVCVRT